MLESGLPRDLETIVHKCIEKQVSDRYQTAGDVAEDLKRFLHDEPIHARRLSSFARCQRWCRKNPVIAILSLCLLTASLLLGVSQSKVTWERNRYRTALFESLLAQSKFHRLSGQSGQRWESLNAIADAATLQMEPKLRDQAVQCMTLSDLEPVFSWPVIFPSYAIDSVDVSPNLAMYVAYSLQGIELRQCPKSPSDGSGRIISLLKRRILSSSRCIQPMFQVSHD